jgi:hypothetical protein
MIVSYFSQKSAPSIRNQLTLLFWYLFSSRPGGLHTFFDNLNSMKTKSELLTSGQLQTSVLDAFCSYSAAGSVFLALGVVWPLIAQLVCAPIAAGGMMFYCYGCSIILASTCKLNFNSLF